VHVQHIQRAFHQKGSENRAWGKLHCDL